MPHPFPMIAVLSAVSMLVCSPGSSAADEMIGRGLPQAGTGSEMAQDLPASVGVTIDFAKVLTFAEPARTIIIGNPGIVDGTLNDEHTIVLTGKVAGVTNLIVLGEGGREILNAAVRVAPSSHQVTTVYSGSSQKTFSCAGSCKPVLSVGDDGTHFNNAREQIRGRQDFLGIGVAAPR